MSFVNDLKKAFGALQEIGRESYRQKIFVRELRKALAWKGVDLQGKVLLEQIYDYQRLCHWGVMEKERGLTDRVKKAQKKLLEKYEVDTREKALLKIAEDWQAEIGADYLNGFPWVKLQLQYLEYLELNQRAVKKVSAMECCFDDNEIQAGRLRRTAEKLVNEKEEYAKKIWSLRPKFDEEIQFEGIKEVENLIAEKIDFYNEGLKQFELYGSQQRPNRETLTYLDAGLTLLQKYQKSSEVSQRKFQKWLSDWAQASGGLKKTSERQVSGREIIEGR